MKLTFRWYGEKDCIPPEYIRQIQGMTGVVTAVYDVPVGEVWPFEKLERLKTLANSAGLEMEVIESIPVHEDIKLGKPTRDKLIENYAQNIINCGKAGVKCVCYNFMPVFDWFRTNLHSMERINEKPLNHLSFLIRPEYFEKVCGAIYEDLYEKLLNADYPLSFQVSDPEIETIKIKLNAIKRFIPEEAEHNIRKTKIVFLSIFALFVENFEQKTSPFPPWLDTLLGKLNESKFDELTLKELANETPYSYSRMSVLFKQYLGMPLIKYVNNIKLAKAANVLINTTKGILEIAFDLGYTSLSSFNHGFKNAYGVSPSVYRKKIGKTGMFPPFPPSVPEDS